MFVNHATSHHGDFFELLWEFGKITQQQQEMLRASDYMAFRYAALRGDLYILTRLWTWATELGVSKDMITSSDYGAFRNSVTNNSMDVAAKLYVYAGPLNLQEELMGMLTENQRQSLLRRVDNNFNFL